LRPTIAALLIAPDARSAGCPAADLLVETVPMVTPLIASMFTVPHFMLFCMAICVVSVFAVALWEKFIAPGLEEKKRLKEEAEAAVKEAEEEAAAAEVEEAEPVAESDVPDADAAEVADAMSNENDTEAPVAMAPDDAESAEPVSDEKDEVPFMVFEEEEESK
jgi:Tfp pilus assembly protein PilX